ncbi:MAG: hypothetical protein FWD93_05365, partial [Coriobacteriia bacterium]|nr:hypothetical protein [Coriobacteriia bacterium]
LLREHAQMTQDWYGEPYITRMRKHAAWYVAGQPAATIFRSRLHSISTMDDLDILIAEYLERHG